MLRIARRKKHDQTLFQKRSLWYESRRCIKKVKEQVCRTRGGYYNHQNMPKIEGNRGGKCIGKAQEHRERKLTLRILTRKSIKESGRGRRWPIADHQAQGTERNLTLEHNKRIGRDRRQGGVLLKFKNKV